MEKLTERISDERIEKLIKLISDYVDTKEEMEGDEDLISALRELKEARAELDRLQQQEWIAVTPETMPKIGQHVLVCSSKRPEWAPWIDWTEMFHDGLEWVGESSEIPTHWRIFPAPPVTKEGK